MRVEQHGPGEVLEVPDALFGNTIHPMGVYCTEGKCLGGLLDSRAEFVVGKSAIVGVIVADSDTMSRCIVLKCFLSLCSFDNRSRFL